jgi:hypothetical protein
MYDRRLKMAFALRNLSVLAYANGFTLWHYKSASDDQQAVAAPGYFNNAGDMLSSGDMVMFSAAEGGRVLCVALDEGGVRTAPL